MYQSGLPYTLSYSNCGATLPSDAPCYVNGNPGALAHGVSTTPYKSGAVQYFKPQALGGSYTAAPLDTIGNGGRNTAWGPNFFNSDMSISKNITFHERYAAQFRMDAYNAFNHINFNTPNGTLDNTSSIGNGSPILTGGSINSGPYPCGYRRHHQPTSAAVHDSSAVLTLIEVRVEGEMHLLPPFSF